MRRTPWRLVVPAFGVMVAALLPLITGQRTLFLRDLLNYHYTVKLVQARAMAEGFLPLVDPFRAGGQPLVGNLNNVPLYPDNLLYLMASPFWAMNAHMWIHLLLAPLSCYWMARAWGLGRQGAWTAGFLYGTSGFFLSQLNLYNMIAGTALAPAFVAACLSLARGQRKTLSLLAVGGCWCLTILAGEPLMAALVLVVGASACVARGGVPLRTWVQLGGAIACGTLLAAPQLTELARILPTSYRVGVGFTHESRLIGSWDPRTIVEWFIPLFFGEPGFRYWGQQLLRGAHPLLYSLYPGVLSLALLTSSRRPRTRVEVWSWGALIGGLFVALGGWNPVVFMVLRLPQAGSLRYPVKWFLLVALGGALLGGLAYERCVLGDGRRRLGARLAVLAALLAAAWLILTLLPGAVVSGLGGLLASDFAAMEIARWRGLLLLSLAILGAYGLLLARAERWRWAAPAMVWVHVGSQLFFLGSLAASDDLAAYQEPPQALQYIEPGEQVVQSCVLDFGCGGGGVGAFPDARPLWLQRRGWSELFPFAGVGYNIHYAFNTSPEGLDSVLPAAAAEALAQLDDPSIVRLLAASSIDVLLISRPLSPEVADMVRLRATVPTVGSQLWIYGISKSAPDVRLVGRIRAGDTAVVLRELIHPDFDPENEVYLPGRQPGLTDGELGTVRETATGRESWTYETESRDDGLLVLARSHLPLYVATVDGEPKRTLVVNMGQLAVEIPAGRHQVRIVVDRAPFHRSIWGAGAGLIALCGLALIAGRDGERPRDNHHVRAASGPRARGVGESRS